ncbi:MAG: alpha/beta fold hydrolase, partial [Thermodesulfobacteriota bacterium]
GAQLRLPVLFMAGEEDGVITLYRHDVDHMEEAVPNLWKKVLVPGAGHWIQQERPKEVNEQLIEFLQR